MAIEQPYKKVPCQSNVRLPTPPFFAAKNKNTDISAMSVHYDPIPCKSGK